MEKKKAGVVGMGQDRIVRPKEASAITGRSASSLWRDEKSGRFPRRIRIGENAVGYKLSAILAWLDSRDEVCSDNAKLVAPDARRGRKPKVTEVTEVGHEK